MVGAITSAYYLYDEKSASLVLNHHADIAMNVGVLNEIKRGDIDKARKLLEILLDGEIIGLTGFVDNGSPHQKRALEAARIAANYRKHSSYRPEDESVRNHIKGILDKGYLTNEPCESPNKALNNNAQNARAC